MNKIYKLEWEYVSAVSHPDAYHGDHPAITPDSVPENYWSKVNKTGFEKDLTSQFEGLVRLIEQRELVRNPKLYSAEILEPIWQTVKG